MIRAIFFDLDWTILNSEPVYKMFDPIVELIEEADVSDDVKEKYRKSLRGLTDDGHTSDLPEETVEKIRALYPTLEVPGDIEMYGDEHCIEELGTTNFLITTGFKKFQQQKIDILGIAPLFKGVFIDVVDGEKPPTGKKTIFQNILDTYGYKPTEVLVVGDKASSELTAGNELGIPTVQILRPKIERWDNATHHIESLCELKDIVDNPL